MRKTIFTLIIMSVLACNLFAQQTQNADSIDYNKEWIELLQNSIDSLKSSNAELSKTLSILERRNRTAENELSQLQSELRSLKNDLDSTNNLVSTNAQNTKAIADTLGLQIKETNAATDSKVATVAEKLGTTTIWGVVAVAITLIISLLVAFLLHKRGNKNVTELQKKAEELNEKIVGQFSTEMSELQKLSKSIEALQAASAGTAATEPDHSLAKALADRITFMEMTLYKMDSSIKGHKQLTKSISQMKDNLLANGYELVDMLGKDYNEGMKASVSFDDNEEIEQGKRIITKIIKPQINYKGVMIQSAQITVSQNI